MENYFFNTEEFHTEKKQYVLIIYDVVDNRRRQKLAKFLSGYGFRVQKSAFEAIITERVYNRLMSAIPAYIKKEEDSLRIYKFRGYGEVTLLGVNEKVQDEEVIII